MRWGTAAIHTVLSSSSSAAASFSFSIAPFVILGQVPAFLDDRTFNLPNYRAANLQPFSLYKIQEQTRSHSQFPIITNDGDRNVCGIATPHSVGSIITLISFTYSCPSSDFRDESSSSSCRFCAKFTSAFCSRSCLNCSIYSSCLA